MKQKIVKILSFTFILFLTSSLWAAGEEFVDCAGGTDLETAMCKAAESKSSDELTVVNEGIKYSDNGKKVCHGCENLHDATIISNTDAATEARIFKRNGETQ